MTDSNTSTIIDNNFNDISINNLLPLAKDCLLGKYILIVGSECILDPVKRQDVDGDSNKLLLKHISESLGFTRGKSEDEKELDVTQRLYNELNNSNSPDLADIKKKWLEKIEMLKKRIKQNPPSQIPTINELTHLYNENEIQKNALKITYNRDDFNPELKKLLETKCFRIVITTAVDHFLEKEMRDIWGEELNVLNIFDERDWGNATKPINDFCDTPPTLYYAFGKLDNKKKYVLTEDDAMEAIAMWGGNERPRKFGTYISNIDDKKTKYLISIGCNLENWQFRFFWYQLLGKRLRNQNKKGTVAMTFEDNKKLKKYLDENWSLNTADNTQSFLQCLIVAINKQFGTYYPASEYIFISYAHEDSAIAHALAATLVDRGFNVWLDTKLAHDGNDNEYDGRIQNAISGCSVFLPILTLNVAHELQTGETKKVIKKNEDGNEYETEEFKRYFFQEWQWMQELRKDQKIQPLSYSGFSTSANYFNNITQKCITGNSVFTTSSGNIDDLCRQLEGLLHSSI